MGPREGGDYEVNLKDLEHGRRKGVTEIDHGLKRGGGGGEEEGHGH